MGEEVRVNFAITSISARLTSSASG